MRARSASLEAPAPMGLPHASADLAYADPSGDLPSLLILAYRFPPQARVGSHRTTKFVKYLGRFGWRPVVHTVRNPYSPHLDPTLSGQIPADVPVFRTPTVELEGLETRLGWARDLWRGSKPLAPAAPSLSNGAGPDLPARLRDHAWRYWFVPDPQIPWVPAAFLRSLWIARRLRVAAIYSTSPPHSVQLAGLGLKRWLGLPWIADLRDPWTEGLHRRRWYERNDARRRREERWEEAVCRSADRVLVATEGARETLGRKYPETAHKIACITNGFDVDDFVRLSPERRHLAADRLHVTLAGQVESAFDLLPLFRTVRDLVARAPRARVLQLNFVGTRRRRECDAFLAAHGLEDVIVFHEPVPHPVCLQILSESDVGLIAAAERQRSRGIKISSKLYEYLYLRKPVLALIEEGVTTRILARARLGLHAAPDDHAAITAHLESLVDQFLGGEIRVDPDEEYIEGFDRRRQAQALATILDEVVKPQRLHVRAS